MKTRPPRIDEEEAALISLAVSFGLLLFTVWSCAMWESLKLFIERVSTLAIGEIP